MPKQDALQGALDLMVLKILSRRSGLHGYAIMTAIEEMSEGVLRVEEGPSIRPCAAWRKPAGCAPSGSRGKAGAARASIR